MSPKWPEEPLLVKQGLGLPHHNNKASQDLRGLRERQDPWLQEPDHLDHNKCVRQLLDNSKDRKLLCNKGHLRHSNNNKGRKHHRNNNNSQGHKHQCNSNLLLLSLLSNSSHHHNNNLHSNNNRHSNNHLLVRWRVHVDLGQECVQEVLVHQVVQVRLV